MKFIRLVGTVLITFSLYCCKANKSQLNSADEVAETKDNPSPEIVIINFYLNSFDTVKVEDVFSNVGKLRALNSNDQILREGDLLISLTDESEALVVKSIIENPLQRKAEYSTNRDTGEIKAETMDLKEANFFIRIQYETWFHHVKIERLENDELKLLKVLPFFKPTIK